MEPISFRILFKNMLLLLHMQNISSQNILSNVIKINEFSYPSIIFLSIVGTIVMRHLFLFQCYSSLYWDTQIKLPNSCFVFGPEN